jgi:ABC-type sugar transport system ATPase subunit
VPFHGDRDAMKFDGTVDVVESLGSEQHVLVTLPKGTITVRMPSDRRVETGATLRLGVPAEHLHLFDANTKRRVGP